MTALRRVVSAGGWVLGLWLLFVALAEFSGMLVGTAAAGAAEPYAGPAPGREDLFAVAQLAYLNPGVLAVTWSAPAVTALMGAGAWTLLASMVIARLDGPKGSAALGEIWLRTLPAVLVQSLWHLVLRGILVVIVAVSVGPLSPIAMLCALALAWWVASLALDLTRTGVVLHDATPWHPATALYAFARAATRPRLLGITILLSIAQLLCALAIGWAAVHAIGPGSSSVAAFALALVGVAVGVTRLSVVVDHGAVPLHSRGKDTTPS